MTGQIPKYGANFRHERRAYSATLGSAAYVLKSDAQWEIRSDKTSKRWFVFCADVKVSGTFSTLTLAMSACVSATAMLAGNVAGDGMSAHRLARACDIGRTIHHGDWCSVHSAPAPHGAPCERKSACTFSSDGISCQCPVHAGP